MVRLIYPMHRLFGLLRPLGGALTNPVSGDNWYFTNTAATTLTFNYPTNWVVSGISINSGANAFSIGGGTITLTGNITNNSSYATGNGNTISSALIVNSNVLITNTANGSLHLEETFPERELSVLHQQLLPADLLSLEVIGRDLAGP